jgi:hypothetical protein
MIGAPRRTDAGSSVTVSLLAAPLAAEAQQTGAKVYRIGWLGDGTRDGRASRGMPTTSSVSRWM